MKAKIQTVINACPKSWQKVEKQLQGNGSRDLQGACLVQNIWRQNHPEDALYLKGVSLGIQDLTDNLGCVLHDVSAGPQLLALLEGMVDVAAWLVAVCDWTIPVDVETACVWG
jgi:hypothetical protein